MPEKKILKEKEAAGVQQAISRDVPLLWLGPAIAGVVMPGTVYRNGLTPQLQEAVKELPALNKLLVPTVAAAQVRKDLKNPQSAVSICYQRALEYTEKGEKG